MIPLLHVWLWYRVNNQSLKQLLHSKL
jgi:hypothetical protein